MSDEARNEDELLRHIAGGDMRALEALYRVMRVRVFAVALAVAGDRGTAEDVTQDTFVRVYAAAPGYARYRAALVRLRPLVAEVAR